MVRLVLLDFKDLPVRPELSVPRVLPVRLDLSARRVRLVNRTHPVVMPVQKRLHALGYVQVGKADGVAGSGFERAVKAFQTDNNGEVDGEITAGGPTWRKLLELP